MKLSVLAVMAMAMAANVHALFRVRCEDSVALMRSDPIVSPGSIASHLHTFHGPNTISSKADFDTLQQADCSSCALKLDNSAYWTPTLFYKHKGQYHPVGQKGGMLVYYHFRNDTRLTTPQGWGHENVDVFPKDFKMLAGDPLRRSAPGPDATEQEKRSYKAIGFNCLRYQSGNEDTTANHAWRKDDWQTCYSGIRAELWLPSCWDGRSDSDNHRDHVAYPDEVKVGRCPSSHPKRLPTLLFETVWSTDDFAKPEFEGGEFVWSHGDPTGYGYHGDFQNGWVEGVLEKTMQDRTCYDDSENNRQNLEDCKTFKSEDIRKPEEQLFCKRESEWDEEVGGEAGFGQGFRAMNFKPAPLPALPGCNPVSYGPERAAHVPACDTNGKPIDGSTKPTEKPTEKPEGTLLNNNKNKGVKLDTPVVETPNDIVEQKEESSTIEDKPATLSPVEEVASTSTATTSSNKYLVIVTTTQTRTVTEGEPVPTEWLRRRHVHGKHRRHHKH